MSDIGDHEVAYWRERLDVVERERDRYGEALRRIVAARDDTRFTDFSAPSRYWNEAMEIASEALGEDA